MIQAEWAFKVDWNKYDAELARELDISRERVRQVRKLMGKESSRSIKKPKRFKVDLKDVNWDLTNNQLAKNNDICSGTVASQRTIYAPHTKNQSIKPLMTHINWNLSYKEINKFLLKRFNRTTSQQNLSRYKMILAPHLVKKRNRAVA